MADTEGKGSGKPFPAPPGAALRIELLSEPAAAAGNPDAGSPDAGPADSFLQSAFWGDFKASFGWKARSFQFRVEVGGQSPRLCRLLVLEKRLAGPFSFAYIPEGPAFDPPAREGSAFLAALAQALKPRLSASCLFLRFDPPWYEAESSAPAEPEAELEPEPGTVTGKKPAVTEKNSYPEPDRPRFELPLRKAAADVQPPDSVLLDLKPSEAELLAAMKPKWRYNVRLAEKKGVVVAEEGLEALPVFYELYEATARRDRIALHPQTYYARLFELAAAWKANPAPAAAASAGGSSAVAPASAEQASAEQASALPASAVPAGPDLRLWVARHEGEALAAIVTLFRGECATYLYGASSDLKRNLMPAYALQWSAIKAAKAAGCKVYDFYGLPPSADPGHPMAGLYRFKTGFGGTLIHYAGSWDYPLKPLAYAAFRAAESLRSFYFKRLRKLGRS